jgi:hypothetical protein
MISTRWIPRRRARSQFRYLRLLLLLAVFTFCLDMFHARRCWTNTIAKDRRRPFSRQGQSKAQQEGNEGDEDPAAERIFIASTHWNSEGVLRSHWNAAVVELVQSLGAENVYISIYEGGSWDDTKGALRELDAALARLNVPRTVVLSEVTHQEEISRPPAPTGWIDTARGHRELRRIPFLSRQRNGSLQPLFDIEKETGEQFDKILFLNDVVFKVCIHIYLLFSFSHTQLEKSVQCLTIPTERRFLHLTQHPRRRIRRSLCARLLQTAQLLRHVRITRFRRPRTINANMAILSIAGVTIIP